MDDFDAARVCAALTANTGRSVAAVFSGGMKADATQKRFDHLRASAYKPDMKKQFILCLITLLAIAPIYLGQAKPAKADKSAPSESTITDLEKSAWEAYKNKQADAFRR